MKGYPSLHVGDPAKVTLFVVPTESVTDVDDVPVPSFSPHLATRPVADVTS